MLDELVDVAATTDGSAPNARPYVSVAPIVPVATDCTATVPRAAVAVRYWGLAEAVRLGPKTAKPTAPTPTRIITTAPINLRFMRIPSSKRLSGPALDRVRTGVTSGVGDDGAGRSPAPVPLVPSLIPGVAPCVSPMCRPMRRAPPTGVPLPR